MGRIDESRARHTRLSQKEEKKRNVFCGYDIIVLLPNLLDVLLTITLRTPHNSMTMHTFSRIFVDQLETLALGRILVGIAAPGLVALQIGGEWGAFTQRLAARFGVTVTPAKFQADSTFQQIRAYLEGTRTRFDLPIHWDAQSAFQQQVLKLVCQVPYGETRTYGQIAAQLGKPRAARAVGRANATNPLPLVIPCHRLVGADGSLRVYGTGAGLQTKQWLLDFERGQSSGA